MRSPRQIRALLSSVVIALLFASSATMARPPRPLAELKQALKEKPDDIRALTEVGKHGTKEAAEILAASPALKSKPRNVTRGFKGLKDPAAAPVLHPLLAHQEKFVRASVAEALGRLGNAKSAGPLMALIAKEEDRNVKNKALEALGPCASTRDELQPVLDHLEDQTFKTGARKGMKGMLEPMLAPALFPYMKSKDKRLVGDVIDTLGNLASPEAGTVLLDVVQKSDDRSLRTKAVRALAHAADKRHLARMMKIATAMKNPEQAFYASIIAVDRRYGYKTLKKLFKKRDKKSRAMQKTFVLSIHKDPHPSDDVLPLTLIQSKDDQDRRVSMNALGAVGTPAARDALCSALKKMKKPQWLQSTAAENLGKYRDDKAIACLIDGFAAVKVRKGQSPSQGAQREIAKSLRRITGEDYEYDVKAWKAWHKSGLKGPDSAIEALAHKDVSVRVLAAKRLSEAKRQHHDKAKSALVARLAEERNASAKIAIVESLAVLGAESAKDSLVLLLDSNDVEELEAVAKALDGIGDGRGTLRLIELVAEGGSKADEAANALARVTGEPVHKNPRTWRAWWAENAERYRK